MAKDVSIVSNFIARCCENPILSCSDHEKQKSDQN